MLEFLKRDKVKTSGKVELPEAFMPEDPVNYNSVLDYLVGLSDKDYKKMTGSVDIYREANKKVAKLVGIKDEPTTSITPHSEVSEQQLDEMLEADPKELKQAFIDDGPVSEKPKKAQATEKKVEVK